jgi:hypothetical protein
VVLGALLPRRGWPRDMMGSMRSGVTDFAGIAAGRPVE